MRRAWLCVVSLAVLLAVGAGAAQAAAPVIERVDFELIRELTTEGATRYDSAAAVWVRDADGASDITEIAIDGRSYGPGSAGSGEWTEEAPDLVRLTAPLTIPSSGACTVTATDASAHTDGLSFAVPAFPQPAPTMIAPGANYPVLPSPEVTFSWSGLLPNAAGTLTVQRLSGGEVWCFPHTGDSTSVAYNVDGTASEPLYRGFTYGWSLSADAALDDGVTDPRVHTSVREKLNGQFIIYSAAPTIQTASLGRCREAPIGGPPCYGERAGLTVTDCSGWAHLASVTIAAPDGVVRTITPSGGGHWQQEDRYTVGALYCPPPCLELTDPVPPGTYTFAAADAEGQTCTLSATTTQAQPALRPLSPPQDGVVDDLRPLFTWDAGLAGASVDLRLGEEGRCCLAGASGLLDGEWQYHSDEPLGRQELLPGRTYVWTLQMQAREPTSDGRVWEYFHDTAESRFTEYAPWPALPELEGELVYGLYSQPRLQSMIQRYQPSPLVREWLGPVGACDPDLSADGTKVSYISRDELWIDSRDGGSPLRIADRYAMDARWSPDGAQLVYSHWGELSWMPDIWIVAADGTGGHPLLLQDGMDHWPAWSPDGKWISYCRSVNNMEGFLWLVRPDGTGNHSLLVTGVAGYPDYQVESLGASGWSPEAARLVVAFDAVSSADPAASRLSGIGTISRDGGLLTPVFIAPAGCVCCAAPRMPYWSPDGSKIAFVSAHHLPLCGVWPTGYYEAGAELWVASVDGTGEPVRLSYNQSLDDTISWWAPNTLAGSSVSVTRGDATITFDSVIAEGSTTVCLAPEPPAPPPAGYTLLGDCWKLITNAQTTGGIGIALRCDPALAPADRALRLLAFGRDGWADITTSVDAVAQTVWGRADDLSYFAPGLVQTHYEDDDPAVTYAGAWQTYFHPAATAGHARYSSRTGTFATLAFTGTGIRWHVAKGPMMGIAKLKVDESAPRLVDLYRPTSLLTAIEKLGLPSGMHTLTIEVSGLRNPASKGYAVSIDALEVVP